MLPIFAHALLLLPIMKAMKIIISPAKKMKLCEDHDFPLSTPVFMEEHDTLFQVLVSKSYEELFKLYSCSLRTFNPVYEELQRQKAGIFPPVSPALLSYDGIAFRYMAPDVFDDTQWDYICRHLRILSAMYGILKPLDGVVPYRLEMQQKLPFSLYDFWGSKLKEELEDEVIVNLASKEYSRCIGAFQTMITPRFFELENGKRKEKGVYAKMARGAMVRWMAEHQIEDWHDLKDFQELGYHFDPESSDSSTLVFIRKEGSHA